VNVVRRLFLVERATPPTDDGATFIASTAASDRYGDVVDQASWKLDGYKLNPVIQIDHDYSAESTVGRAAAVEVRDGALIVDVKWGSDERSQRIGQKVKDGLLSAVSVGFIPGRATRRSEFPADDPYYADGKENPYGYAYYDNELLEISVVAVPANQEALAQRSAPAPVPGLSEPDVERIISRLLPRLLAARELSAPVPPAPTPDTSLESWLAGAPR
jgi:HK97 family phage prohead protease